MLLTQKEKEFDQLGTKLLVSDWLFIEDCVSILGEFGGKCILYYYYIIISINNITRAFRSTRGI